jgi:hypothetical protein
MELPEDIKNKMRTESPDIYTIWEKIEKNRKGDNSVESVDSEKTKLSNYLSQLKMLTGAKDIIDGRKIKVTKNVWFIGTANRDESTFEISDKVYDRAQVISLNEKGKEGKYKSVKEAFIDASALLECFNQAIDKFDKKSEVQQKLAEIDNLLMEKFDVSFGNRIETQTVDFAAVFCAAGGKWEDALDYQISTKILRKIVSSDDKEALTEFLSLAKGYVQTEKMLAKQIKELS